MKHGSCAGLAWSGAGGTAANQTFQGHGFCWIRVPLNIQPARINLSEVCLRQAKPVSLPRVAAAMAAAPHGARIYLRQRLHDGVQESSHPLGHLQKLQDCRGTQEQPETS